MDAKRLRKARDRWSVGRAALTLVGDWYARWVRYHEARYRYLGAMLDGAVAPRGSMQGYRLRQSLNSHGDQS